MKPYRLHLFVCQGKACLEKGSERLLAVLRDKLNSEGIKAEIKTSKTGCLGVCKDSEPKGTLCNIIVVYPKGIWYQNITEENIDEIVERHLKNGEIVEKFLYYKM